MNLKAMVLNSSSDGELIAQNDMTEPQTAPVDAAKLKRTFTLPRNPFNGQLRMSKRKPKTKDSSAALNGGGHEPDLNGGVPADENNMKSSKSKVFRRPSIRMFINKIAQHIGGVPVIGQGVNGVDPRVPPVGLQTWGPEETPGVTGLKNHGNTCFINAVMQCISNTDVLSEYFVLDR